MSQWIFIYKWPSPVSGIQQPTTSARLRRGPASTHLRRRLVFIICQCSLRHQSVGSLRSVNSLHHQSVGSLRQINSLRHQSVAFINQGSLQLSAGHVSVRTFADYSSVNGLRRSVPLTRIGLHQSITFVSLWPSSFWAFVSHGLRSSISGFHLSLVFSSLRHWLVFVTHWTSSVGSLRHSTAFAC